MDGEWVKTLEDIRSERLSEREGLISSHDYDFNRNGLEESNKVADFAAFVIQNLYDREVEVTGAGGSFMSKDRVMPEAPRGLKQSNHIKSQDEVVDIHLYRNQDKLLGTLRFNPQNNPSRPREQFEAEYGALSNIVSSLERGTVEGFELLRDSINDFLEGSRVAHLQMGESSSEGYAVGQNAENVYEKLIEGGRATTVLEDLQLDSETLRSDLLIEYHGAKSGGVGAEYNLSVEHPINRFQYANWD